MGTSKFGRRGAAVSGVPGIVIRSNAWSGTPWCKTYERKTIFQKNLKHPFKAFKIGEHLGNTHEYDELNQHEQIQGIFSKS